MFIVVTVLTLIVVVPIAISIVTAVLKIKGKLEVSWFSVFGPIFLLLGGIAFLAFGLLLMYFGNYSL
ncbi:hypothetical protein [Enterococcus faecium]|uniref:hypothetical protein n=1 Tax=Enterococcus faecium TaxID=1352 RepID=UPI0011E7636B|nr:hypothetical protein [Enterococcus faecium]TYR09644.1 hypothetical protein BEK95_10980 [Enterococcus faecium]